MQAEGLHVALLKHCRIPKSTPTPCEALLQPLLKERGRTMGEGLVTQND
jgi:hypothetical protein